MSIDSALPKLSGAQPTHCTYSPLHAFTFIPPHPQTPPYNIPPSYLHPPAHPFFLPITPSPPPPPAGGVHLPPSPLRFFSVQRTWWRWPLAPSCLSAKQAREQHPPLCLYLIISTSSLNAFIHLSLPLQALLLFDCTLLPFPPKITFKFWLCVMFWIVILFNRCALAMRGCSECLEKEADSRLTGIDYDRFLFFLLVFFPFTSDAVMLAKKNKNVKSCIIYEICIKEKCNSVTNKILTKILKTIVPQWCVLCSVCRGCVFCRLLCI